MVGRNILENEEADRHEIIAPSSANLNLLDRKAIEKFLLSENPDLIVHSAGLVGGIQANMEKPVRFLVENMQMGINVLMASKTHGVKRFMNLGSSCMYPRDATNPLSEDLILKGELEPTNEGYAIAKVASTRLCEYISREDESFLYKTVIPCNLYGKYDKFDPNYSHMIPAVIRKINHAKNNNSECIDIWGDGLARREFMYAADFASFVYYAIGNFETMPQNINVGLGHDYSINEYYKKIADVVGFKGVFSYDLTRPTGMQQKLMEDSMLKKFGWQHQSTLEQGLQMTYQYYLDEVEK